MDSQAKISVAIVIPGGIGTGRNSIGVPVLERIVKLLAKDYTVTVFQLFRTNEDYRPDGFRIISIPSENRIVRMLKFLCEFRRYHQRDHFTVVHGFWINPCGFLAVVAGKLFSIKSIVSVQGGDAIFLRSINYGQLRNSFSRKIAWWTLRNATEVTALTKYLVDNLNSIEPIRRDIGVIPFGVDTSVFSFKGKKMSSPVKILNIGNLYPVKDQVTLLRAFKIISEKVPCELTIIGEGILESQLRKTISELGLLAKVSILRPLPYDALPLFYHEADVMMHTSLSEGQGVVLAEAMSCGVVVCGTRVGLLYDLPECCVSVPVGDYEKLAFEVLTLLGDVMLFDEKKKRALGWATKYTLSWTVGEFKKIYSF